MSVEQVVLESGTISYRQHIKLCRSTLRQKLMGQLRQLVSNNISVFFDDLRLKF